MSRSSTLKRIAVFIVTVAGLTGCTSMTPMPLDGNVPSDEVILAGSKVTHVNYGTSDYEFGRLYRGPLSIKKIGIVTCQAGNVHGKATGDSKVASALLDGLVSGLEKEGFEVILPETISKTPSAKDFIANQGGAGHAKGSRDPVSGLGNVVNVQHYDESAAPLARDTGADVFFFIGVEKHETNLYAYVPYARFKTACEAKDTSTTIFSFNHGRQMVLRYSAPSMKILDLAKLVGQITARRFRLYYPSVEQQ